MALHRCTNTRMTQKSSKFPRNCLGRSYQSLLIHFLLPSLIAVTGLGGHAFGSWKLRDSHKMWLRDYLPKDLPKQRIILYGYDTTLQNSQSKQSIEELGKQLWDHISAFRNSTKVCKRQRDRRLGANSTEDYQASYCVHRP